MVDKENPAVTEQPTITDKPAVVPGPVPLGAVLENLLAPELYATTATFFALTNGVLTMTLTSSRFDSAVAPPARRQVVIARVTMPVTGAAELATGLYNFLSTNGFQFATPAEKERMQ